MRRIDTIRRAGRSLRQAKTRTFLTSMAIAVGAFTLTLSIAAGEGSRQYVEKVIQSNVDPQMLYVSKDKTLVGEGGMTSASGLKEYSPETTQYGGLSIKALNADDLKTLKDRDDIVEVVPTYLVNAQYVTFEGSDKRYTSDITVYDKSVRTEVAAGNLPELGAQIEDNEIVVPEAYLDTLNVGTPRDIIGKTVTLRLVKQPNFSPGQLNLDAETRDVSFTIRAVSKQSATSLAASNGLFISENQAKELSDYLTEGTPQYQTYVALTAKVKDGIDPETVKNDIRDDDLYAMTAEDLQGLLFTIVNLIQGIVIGFGVLALIASIFGIVNTQYISVLERVRQIGLMKSLGTSSRDISKLFRYEAAWIGFLGGVIGAALAWGVGTAINPWLTELLGIGEGNYILAFQIAPIAALIVALMLVAVIAGYFPARKAARLDPIEALRTE